MLGFVQDTLKSWQLQARYRRVVQEQLLSIATESQRPTRVEEDPENWFPLGGGSGGWTDGRRQELRDRVRKLVQENCHGRNILRLLESYVTGPGLSLSHRAREATADLTPLVAQAERLWREFLTANQRHFSFREHARRAWRDGETFVRKVSSSQWPPQVRFIDPEQIGPTPEFPDSAGIVTAENDVESPRHYLRVDSSTARLVEIIPARDMRHTRVGVDSNVKRGVSIFAPILQTLDSFDRWIDTELQARKLQSSIVLWRKVQGSPQLAKAMADGAAGGATNGAGMRLERFRPGTVVTTNHGTDIQFLQPNTNFGDAVPLGRMLLLNVAAGAGLPEFMLTSDASNGNFSSTMVAEGPAVKFFQSEQQFFAGEFTCLWRWIMQDAVALGLLPANALELVEPHWSFPSLVNRDRPRERLADVQLVESGVLSRAEVARRDGVDPETMRTERVREVASEEHRGSTPSEQHRPKPE